MALTIQRGRAERLRILGAWLAQEGGVLVTTTLEVYRRGADDEPEVIRREPDLRVIVVPGSGTRVFPEDRDDFDELAAQSQRHDVVLSVHEGQVAPLLSKAKIVGILSGAQAGKSEVLAARLFRAWLLRGRVKVTRGTEPGLFWWVGPTLEKAFRVGCKKLASLIPPALVSGPIPRTAKASDLAITLIDGCRIEFHHANDDGDNLKGEGVQDVEADEVTAWANPGNWAVLQDRVVKLDASIGVGSTPKTGHWSRELIITLARESDDVEHYEISQFDNPWIPEASIWRSLEARGAIRRDDLEAILAANDNIYDRAEAAKAAITDPLTLREVFGVWTADGVVLYSDFAPERHLTRVLGGPDITEAVVMTVWGGQTLAADRRHVGGQDWNIHPMSTIVAKIWQTSDGRRALHVLDVVQTDGTVEAHAVHLQRRYPGIPIACDSTGFHGGRDAHQRNNTSSTNGLLMREAGFHAIPCWQRFGASSDVAKPANPPQVDSINLTNRLLRQNRITVDPGCRPLIRGLEVGQRCTDGTIYKVSTKRLDVASSPTDALRYLVWKIFRDEWKKLKEDVRARRAA